MFLSKLLSLWYSESCSVARCFSAMMVDIWLLADKCAQYIRFDPTTLFLLWKRPNEKSIFYSMVLGIIVCVVWIVYGYVFGTSPFGIQITYHRRPASLATQIVSLVTTRSGERSDSYQLYKEARKEMKAAIAAGKRV